MNNKIFLSEDANDILIKDDNSIEYEGKVYYLKYLDDEYKNSKGGNSRVYSLYNDDEEYAIKISNYPKPERATYSKNTKRSKESIQRYGRFINEINALNTIQDATFLSNNIINIYFDDEITIKGKSYPYYVMDKADSDLKEYLLQNKDVLDEQEKIKLCYDLHVAIKTLHLNGYYHRDIKPDNILLFKKDDKLLWKIGDLGLVADRDTEFDFQGERIGPFGWISPEAMNKYLTEEYSLGFDCDIRAKSDVFQLGYLFWFVFNLNVPIGIIVQSDFVEVNNDLFDLIYIMLGYNKPNRFSLDEVEEILKPICQDYGVL